MGVFSFNKFVFFLFAGTVSGLTRDEGVTFSNDFLKEFENQIAINDMGPMSEKMFADEIEWDWTGPQNGKGTKEELVAEFANTWGALVSSFMPGYYSSHVVVDPEAGVVAINFDTTINLNLHGKMEDCYVSAPCAIQLKLNEDNKIFYWQFLWDSTDETMLDCQAKAVNILADEL